MPFGKVEWLLLSLIAIVLACNFIEGLAPPADADTMAYHFALPKQFVQAGRLEFVPRALDGAMPLLIHLTYVPAYGLGGEGGLTLWTMVTGWALIGLTYAVARNFVSRPWALATAFLLATTPGMVSGAGSGQVEPRLALFFTVSIVALSRSIKASDLPYLLVAGIAAGYSLGAKYTGLFLVAACGIVLVVSSFPARTWLRYGIVFSLVALITGCEPYIWNWLNSGDPIFPVLFGYVPYRDPSLWDAAHAAQLQIYTALEERGVSPNLFWLLAYPFVATMGGPPIFESGRTGLGPFIVLIMPMALLGIWHHRRALKISALPVIVASVALFYVIWFESGVSQRIRHLLPVYPLLLIAAMAAAKRYVDDNAQPAPLVLAIVLTGTLQFFGLFLYTRNYAQYVFSGETRDAFLERNISGYSAVAWINANLGPQDKVFTTWRQLIYLFEVPVYYAHVVQDARIDIRPEAEDADRYLRQLDRQGITHLLISAETSAGENTGVNQWRLLIPKGCIAPVRNFKSRIIQSRTVPTAQAQMQTWTLYRVVYERCMPDISE